MAKVFKDYFIGWRTLWTEAFRIKEAFGHHPTVTELLDYFYNQSPEIPEDVIYAEFRNKLNTLMEMDLLLETVGCRDGVPQNVLVNIKDPKIYKTSRDAEEENGEESQEIEGKPKRPDLGSL